jgi:hypothetical protein
VEENMPGNTVEENKPVVEAQPGADIDLDKIAADVDAELAGSKAEPEETKAAKPEPKEKPEPKAKAKDDEEDHDAFAERMEREKASTVPYKRFKKINDERKKFMEAHKWRTETEPRLKQYEVMEKNFKAFSERVAKHPFLDKFLNDHFTADGKEPDWKALSGEIGGLVQLAEKQQAAFGSADPAVLQELQRAQNELQVTQYRMHFEQGISAVPKAIKQDESLKGVNVDKEFMEEVVALIPAEVQRLANEGQHNPRPDIVSLAKRVALRHKRIMDAVMSKQAGAIEPKSKVEPVPAKRVVTSTTSQASPVPDAFADPEGYRKYLRDSVDDLAAENGWKK